MLLDELSFDDGSAPAIYPAVATLDRLGLCRELLTLRDRAQAVAGDGNATIQKKANATAATQRRAEALRRQLVPSWRAGAGASLADVLLSDTGSRKAVADLLAAAQSGAAHEQVAAGMFAVDLIEMVWKIENAEKNAGLRESTPSFDPAVRDMARAMAQPASTQEDVPAWAQGYGHAKPIVEDAIKRGVLVEVPMREKLIEAVQAADAGAKLEWSDIDPEAYAKFKALMSEDDAWRQRLLEARSAAFNVHAPGTPEREAAQNHYADLHTEYVAWYEQLTASRVGLSSARNQEWDRRQAALKELGQPVLDAAMADSDVEEGAATDWASQQEITPQAVARLKKLGYPVDQVRRDMAEFYRLVRGRIEKVRIHSKGDRRANATDIGGHGKPGTINIGSSFGKRTLWHELGHHIEADPAAAAAARLYIRMRAESGTNYTLRSLTGNSGYGPKEAALKDGFFDPYVGKVYSWGTTEVFSMGIETFSEPGLLARRIAQDPQTLEFVMGYLKSPKTELSRMHLAMRQSLRQINEDAKDSAEDQQAARIKAAAAKSGFVTDTDTSWTTGKQYDWLMSYGGHKQIGYCTYEGRKVWVYEGSLKSPDTGRRGKAFILKMPDEDYGSVENLNCYSKDIEFAKAMAFLWCRDGVQTSYFKVQRGEFSL